jgi:hypothetical protein
MKNARAAAIAVLAVLGLSGCLGLKWDSRPIVSSIYVSGGTVYAAGRCMVGMKTVPCLWTNGSRTILPGDDGIAASVHVSANTVYVAGSVGGVPCFWTDGLRTDLPAGDRPGSATSIFVADNTVYAAGAMRLLLQDSPCYWVNGTRIDLSDFGAANAIVVSGSTVYVAGCRKGVAGYWADGVSTDLPCEAPLGYQYGTSVQVSEGDVYVGGWYQASSLLAASVFGSNTVACYWRNGTRIDLPGARAAATAGCLTGPAFYTAGFHDLRGGDPVLVDAIPCYWTNTVRTDLSGGRGAAWSIFVSGETVYVAGNLTSTGACYWVDGRRVDLR